MLQHLHISNYALIEALDVDFEEGFSVITGETGAGKSILLGALGFVTGDRADTGVLYDSEKKCIVEATFQYKNPLFAQALVDNDIDVDDICILRRELTPQKKSRAFINDTPVSLQTLKEIGRMLVDIHSQHDSLLLNDKNFQLHLIDEIAQSHDLLSNYKTSFQHYNETRNQLNQLTEKAQHEVAENDFLRFQLDELTKAQLKDNEYQELEHELQIMENAEEIRTLLYNSLNYIENSDNSILSQLNELSSTASRLEHLVPSTEGIQQRIDSLHIELKDIAYDLDRMKDDTMFDESTLEELQERYDLISRLMMKHHVNDYESLIELRETIKAKVEAFENIDQDIETLKKQLKEETKQLKAMADSLHRMRSEAAVTFSDAVTKLTHQLAMPYAVFRVEVTSLEAFTSTGCDDIRYLFSANKGMEVSDLDKVASGGELSRLMLSIKSAVSQHNYIPTLIFDEIDTGVSGEVASKIGSIMVQMGKDLQLISITHLPQVASKACHHYFIYKDNEGERTQSHIKVLNQQERIEEIAKMLSNDKVTPEAIKAAEVLIR